MGKLLEAVRTAWAHRKLSAGQCEACRGILPDNAHRWCSDECHDAYWESAAV